MKKEPSPYMQTKTYLASSKADLVVFLILINVFVPLTAPFFLNVADVQIIFTILFSPLALWAIIVSRRVGYLLVKKNIKDIEASNAKSSYLQLFGIGIICTITCAIIEALWSGFPYEFCFDTCVSRPVIAVIFGYLVVILLMSIPGYLAIMRCREWYDKYNKNEKN